jgi:hypothetical protein
VQTYIGDASGLKLTIIGAPSDLGSQSELIVEGEIEPGNWEVIERIALSIYSVTSIELFNTRRYTHADGLLKLRLRWESDVNGYDAYIYEILKLSD